MLNKLTLITAAGSLALISASALAAAVAPISHSIRISAIVPTNDFQIEPVDPNTTRVPLQLQWDIGAQAFKPLTAQFTVKAKASVTLKLLDDDSTKLYSAGNLTPQNLTIKFNQITLTTTAQEVVTKVATTAIANYPLVITSDASVTTKSGNYIGTVGLIFEASTI